MTNLNETNQDRAEDIANEANENRYTGGLSVCFDGRTFNDDTYRGLEIQIEDHLDKRDAGVVALATADLEKKLADALLCCKNMSKMFNDRVADHKKETAWLEFLIAEQAKDVAEARKANQTKAAQLVDADRALALLSINATHERTSTIRARTKAVALRDAAEALFAWDAEHNNTTPYMTLEDAYNDAVAAV